MALVSAGTTKAAKIRNKRFVMASVQNAQGHQASCDRSADITAPAVEPVGPSAPNHESKKFLKLIRYVLLTSAIALGTRPMPCNALPILNSVGSE